MANKKNIIIGINLVVIAVLSITLYRMYWKTENKDMHLTATSNGASPIQPTNALLNPPQEPVTDPAKASKIQFDEPLFRFGNIKQGAHVKHTFTFTNTSDKPLMISNAKASCGCTVADWPKSPIPPGGKGEINAEFNSEGKIGLQTKKITVTANTMPAETQITLEGEVYEDPNNPPKPPLTGR